MAKKLFLQGCVIEVPAGESTKTFDCVLTEWVEFHGVMFFPEDPKFRDEVDFKVMMPDGIGGWIEVSDYSKDTFLTSHKYPIEIVAGERDDVSEIPAGFSLRLKYIATDSLGRKAVIWYRLKKII